MDQEQRSIIDFFSEVPDPRRDNANRRHELIDVLVIALCGILSSADDWVSIAQVTPDVCVDRILLRGSKIDIREDSVVMSKIYSRLRDFEFDIVLDGQAEKGDILQNFIRAFDDHLGGFNFGN